MIFAMRKSTFYNTLARQKSIIRFSLFGFSELPSAILDKKNRKIAPIQPFGARKTGWKHTISLHCVFSTQNTRNQRRKSLSIQTLRSATYLPTLAILPDAEISRVTLIPTVCFPLSISLQHGLTTVSSSLLPTVVPLLL